VDIWYSQHGYAPEHPKFVTTSLAADEFAIIDAGTGTTVFRGRLSPIDYGWYQGDFTSFRTPGTYRMKVGQKVGPGSFTIAPHRWDDLLDATAWQYFGLRRMGEDNVVGNLGDERLVNWEHARFRDEDGKNRYKYIGRAWADGDDGRTYASASLIAAQYCALQDTRPGWDRGDWIYQQVRWGLDGTLSFLEKDGTLRWILNSQDHQQVTYDNRFFSGDEKTLVEWNGVRGATEEYNDKNPEVIAASLLIGPAYATALYRDRDPEFFARVDALVQLGYRRIKERHGLFPTKYSLGAWVWLNVAMARMTGSSGYLDVAAEAADRLLSLQQMEFAGDERVKARGWFRFDPETTANPHGEKPEQEVMITPWIYQGLFQLFAASPDHPRAAAWREAVRIYARDYLLGLARRDPFGFTPMKVEVVPQGGKSALKQKRGNLAWSNFSGRIGRQFHQIGNAACLIQAGKLLDDQELIDAGWKQIFWFSGHNPSGLTAINGFGTNANSGQYLPDTLGRRFPGGTVNGAHGNARDLPWFWSFHEYYTYANLNVLWFATVACGGNFSAPLALWPRETRESPHTADPDNHPLATFPVRMKGGFSYAFGAHVPGDPDQPVSWSVDGIPGGNAMVGTITLGGIYQAPQVDAPKEVRIEALARRDPKRRASTAVTILPVAGPVPSLRLEEKDGRVSLTWDAAKGLVSGYTIWKRLPVGRDSVGTIFEMVGATGPGEQSYLYPNGRTRHYEDHVLPAGTEFHVRAYSEKRDPNFNFPPGRDWKPGWALTESPNAIYGFGPTSPPATLNQDLSQRSN